MAQSKSPDASADRARRSGAAPPADDRRLVVVPRPWLALVTALFGLPWLIVAAVYTWPSEPVAPAAAVVEVRPTSVGNGPWGRLTARPIVVSPPLEYVSATFGPVEPTVWYFPETTPDLLRALLTSLGLSPADVDALRAASRPEPAIQGLVVRPDRALVRRLTPDVRERLYVQLSKSGFNLRQREAFRFKGSQDAWFGGSLISPATRARLQPFLYAHGGYTYLADFNLVRDELADVEELRRLSKTLVRHATLLVELTIGNPDEVQALSEYWGRGGRRTDVRPLLESVAAPETPSSIDITHLLPAFARDHLYRYPKLRAADLERPLLVNCLWTSLNFFNQTPDDRFLNADVALSTLKNDYYIVEHRFELGDVVAFVDKHENLFHVAVHLADNLVFTKNGTSALSPWAIMTIDEVKAYYLARSPATKVIFHRRNGL